MWCVVQRFLSNVRVKNTTAEVFFSAGDSEKMAATGAVAAALGLSGAAAGMTAMSMDETKELVCQVTFDIDGKSVEALLWAWPFKEGDEVQAVVEPSEDGRYTGFAVLDPKEKVIVLYPHVAAGGTAHWKTVAKFSMLIAAALNFLMFILIFGAYFFADDMELRAACIGWSVGALSCFGMFVWIGYRVGNRFTPFVRMAEPIFTVLGWKDVKNINLGKITKEKKKPTDPPAMGDSYFRY
nr:putative type VI secretion system effector [Xanthomonas oryzae]